ncbi:MAG: DUF4270 domain-containing protein [Muribaculaceae bacterium]|nr:DUF4270 domain-containing protein [Muribaculaceae bacterium]
MKIKSIFASALALTAITFAACNDNDSPIGSSLTEDSITITVDSTFTVTGHSIANSAVQSRTLLQLLGRIDAKGYGSLSSDVVTQFMPSVSLDTTGVTVNSIDSLKLMMAVYHGNFVGDSITPMGIDIYRLNRNLPSPIYSDFNPEGYFDPSDKLASTVYNASTLGESDSLKLASYHTLSVKLPRELAQEFFTAYKTNPANFASPTAFINNVFKGLYIHNSYGSGRLTLVSTTMMRAYYRRTIKKEDGTDSIQSTMANYFAVTPEIITNNNIGLKLAPAVTEMVNNGDNIVVSPTGYDVEFAFPVKDIISSYRAHKGNESAINTLTFSIPADSIPNEFDFGPAPCMLMVLKSKKAEFFQNNSLPDNVTSFTADYNSTSGCYNFGVMREYLMSLIDKDDITPDDYTFVLTPVKVDTETNSDYYYGSTTTVTSVTPYISAPTLTKISFDKAKIKFTYSNQMINY